MRIFFLPSELEEDNDELCIVASNFVTLYEENNVVARIQLVCHQILFTAYQFCFYHFSNM